MPPALQGDKKRTAPAVHEQIPFPICQIRYAEREPATGRAVLLDCHQARSNSHEFGSRHCRATRVLLDCRHAQRTTVCHRALPQKQKRRTLSAARPHVFYSSCDNCHPPTVCHRALPGENDPWRFRQQSSRVISIPFWYLTSWLPRFLLDQTPSFTQWLSCKTCII